MALPQVPIVPLQSVAPMDPNSTLFNKTWWLFFSALAQSVGSVASTAASSGSGGSGTPSLVPPSNVLSVTVDEAIVDPFTNMVTLVVQVSPPSPIGTFIGCDLFAEIPDQSSTPTYQIGFGLDGTNALNGPWTTIPLGRQVYVPGQAWTIQFSIAGQGLATNIAIPSRLYAVSYSLAVENQLVQANQTGASPNTTFTLEPTTKNLKTIAPTSLSTNSGGGSITISAVVEPAVFVTGISQTPVAVTVEGVPATPAGGWCYQLVLTFAGQDPTVKANQYILTGLFTQSGLVPAGPDAVTTPHTCLLQTPNVVTNATIWLQAGFQRFDASAGSGQIFNPNNIVPGITPSCTIQYGSTAGTVDPLALVTANLAASLGNTGGLFGIANGGVTNPLLGSAAVATVNVQALAVTNPLLASLAVAAGNMASSSVTAANSAIAAAAVVAASLAGSSVTSTAIASAAVGSAAIASAAVGTAAIANAAITNALIANLAVGTAQIQSLAVTDAQISSCNISKLTAGTLNVATCTVTNGFLVTANSITTAISNGSVGGFNAGLITDDGSYNAAVRPGAIVLGTTSLGTTNLILSCRLGAGEIILNSSTGGSGVTITGASQPAASAGSASGNYLNISVGGSLYKITLLNP